MTKTSETILDIKKMGLALEKVSTRTNALTYGTVLLKKKALGPVYDLYLDMKAVLKGLVAVLNPFSKQVDVTGKAMMVLTGPLGLVVKLFTSLKYSVLFFSALLIGLGAVLASSASGTVSLEGAMQALSTAFDFVLSTGSAALDYLGSFDYSILIAGFNGLFDLMLDIAPIAFALFVSMIEKIGEAFVFLQPYIQDFVDSIGLAMTYAVGALYSLYDALQESGFFDALIHAANGLYTGFMAVFGGIKNGMDDTGISLGGIINGIIDGFLGLMNYLHEAGLLDFIVLVMLRLGDLAALAGTLFGTVLEYAIKFFVGLYEFAKPVFSALGTLFSFTLDVLIKLLEGDFIGAIERIFGGIGNFFDGLGGKILGVFSWALGGIESLFTGMYDFVMEILGEIAEALSPITDALSGVGDAIGGAIGGVGDFLGFNDGGVVSGPSSGYPVTLHGTEAVVPLPDGKTIPVSLQGAGNMGGGDNVSFNINVNGAKGDPKEIAKLVGQEVQRAFRTRSRSGGYGRGI